MGIDLAEVDANIEFLVQAAGAVADARSYGLARNLLSSAEMALHDDAMPPVLESLEGIGTGGVLGEDVGPSVASGSKCHASMAALYSSSMVWPTMAAVHESER